MISLNKDLEIGTRKVERWANDIGVKIINMSYEKQDPFFNINTKEDLEIAEKILDDYYQQAKNILKKQKLKFKMKKFQLKIL